MTDTNKVIPNLAKAALKNANGTEKCVICDRELPVDMTQVLLDLKGSSACLQHEGSKELYKWRIKHQKHEIEALQRENERLQAECNAWKQSAEIAEKLALDAQAQNGAMREALRKVQWVDNYTGRGRHCKCCAGNPDKGHSDYCKVGQALAAIDKVIGGQDDV